MPNTRISESGTIELRAELRQRFGLLEADEILTAGTSNCTTEEELRRVIRDAGFKPVQRDTLYRTMFLN